jgi:hypothetical protein
MTATTARLRCRAAAPAGGDVRELVDADDTLIVGRVSGYGAARHAHH